MEDIFDKKIISTAKSSKNIGTETNDKIIDRIANGDEPSGLESLTTVSLDRDMAYNLIDDMCLDSRIASILEAYTEDATCIGDDGRIVYCDSTDEKAAKFVTYILDAYNIDKYIYSWAYGLIKYGDVYIRLYRNSEINNNQKDSNRLDERVEVNYFNSEVDKYSDYCEQVKNPAEMFELKKFGQTCLYIQCPVSSLKIKQRDRTRLSYQTQFQDNNVKVFQPSSFVHGCLNQSYSRVAETISIFDDNNQENTETYTVNRGLSLFYNSYLTWRTLLLLENALLLNRINKTAILRLAQVEIGNVVDEEEANNIVTSVANMLQAKFSLSTQKIASLYLSDQPTVNYAVMPTKNGAGTVSLLELGGEVGEDNLNDVNYFKDKLYGGLRVLKENFGETNGDSAGFDAGGSLAQKSIRYGKAVKRIQNVLVQLVTDIVNARLTDRGLDRYIGKFAIKMHFPVTQEDTSIQAYKKDQIDLVLRIMEALDSVADEKSKLTILKYLLATVIENSDVLQAVLGEIENQAKTSEDNEEESTTESEESERNI